MHLQYLACCFSPRRWCLRWPASWPELVVHSVDPPKAAKSLSSAWLLYPAWGSAWGPGWRRCRGQRNAISTGRLRRGRGVHLTLRSNAWTAAREFDKAETLAVSSEKGEDGSKENWKSDSGRGPVKVVNIKPLQAGKQAICLSHSVRCASHYVYLLMSNKVEQFYFWWTNTCKSS